MRTDEETGSIWSDSHSVCGWVGKGVTQTPSVTAVPGAVTVGKCLPSSIPSPHLQAALEQMRTCDDVMTQVVSSSVPRDYKRRVKLFGEHVDSIVI